LSAKKGHSFLIEQFIVLLISKYYHGDEDADIIRQATAVTVSIN
jgi:hypothetical protein